MKRKAKTIWQVACEYETERGGGMETIRNFLISLHPTTPEAIKDLNDAWLRHDEQMNTWAKSKGF